MSNKITITKEDLADAFNQWKDEYLSDASEFEELEYEDESYAEEMADTMMDYLGQMPDPEV